MNVESIAKMNTRQLGELFVAASRYEKVKICLIPNVTTKSLDGEIKRMINWRIKQQFSKIVNFGDVHEHILRLMVYACKADPSKNTSKQESSKANAIEQTILNKIVTLEKKLGDMKLNGNQPTGQIEDDLAIEKNILETLRKKSGAGEEKKNVFEDTVKMKTLARTVYKILVEDSSKALRLFNEIELFSKPARDTKQDTGGDYRLANSSRDRRFAVSKNNDRAEQTNWRSGGNPNKTPFSDNSSNRSIYRPKFSNDQKTDDSPRPSHNIYRPPLDRRGDDRPPTGDRQQTGNRMQTDNWSQKTQSPVTERNEKSYVPPHLRNVKQSGGPTRNAGERPTKNTGEGEFINFADIQQKKGFNIQSNDFPELGDMQKPTVIRPEKHIPVNHNSTFGVLAMDDDSDDGVDWEDESEEVSTKKSFSPKPIKSQSVWGGGKSFVEITKEGNTLDRLRKEEIERLKEEEQARRDEEKKQYASIPSHKLNISHSKNPRNEYNDEEEEGEEGYGGPYGSRINEARDDMDYDEDMGRNTDEEGYESDEEW